MTVTDFINGKVTYDSNGQYFWIHQKYGNVQMLAELRGWGAIQKKFVKKGLVDLDSAGSFQDELGEWIAKAINEKLERDFIV